MTTLAELTTLGVGGPIKNFVAATSPEEIIAAVSQADEQGEDILIVGGGSNILAADTPFDGTVVHIANQGYAIEGGAACEIPSANSTQPVEAKTAACGGYTVTAQAGQNWDEFVAAMVKEQFVGLEALSGIPGTVGATPIQNVGAYGADVSQTIARVYTWDRQEKKKVSFSNEAMKFSYRDSIFKQSMMGSSPRYIVLSVDFQLEVGDLSAPVKYPELARSLGVEVGNRAAVDQVREQVLKLRASKGMVLNPEDRDTFSTGSFFTNPIVPEDFKLPADAPQYPVGDGYKKLSAAWLISHSGFEKGHGLPGPASLSTKHSLAITNRGSATAQDIVNIAEEVQKGVQKKFGIKLEAEPILINCSL
ncbi:MAG: UDP-N-acetylmuramate dehydrogenase [Micrococcaceae bacterium]